MNRAIDPEAFHRLLRERCLSGEEFRRKVGLSPTTWARLNRGDRLSDDVFRRVVAELKRAPVDPLAQELIPRPQGAVAEVVT